MTLGRAALLLALVSSTFGAPATLASTPRPPAPEHYGAFVPASLRNPTPGLSSSVGDGAGGAIVVWSELRGDQYRVFGQRMNAAGQPQWNAAGLPLCTAGGFQRYPQAVSDGAGGAIVVWEDNRASTTQIYAQRVGPTGTLMWTGPGSPVCTAPNPASGLGLAVVTDGSGGAIATWSDFRGPTFDIYAQRLASNGAAQWTTNGAPVFVGAGEQQNPAIATDGAHGAIIGWEDMATGGGDLRAQRLDASGSTLWSAGGESVCGAPQLQGAVVATDDGAGGAVFAWEDARGGQTDVYAQRVDGAGAMQWAANGIVVCGAGSYQFEPAIASDGAGGAFVAWTDLRSSAAGVYAQRVDGSGTASWTADGVKATNGNFFQEKTAIVSDGAGGAIVVWSDSRTTTSTGGDLYGQRFDAGGARQWSVAGTALCTAEGSQTEHALAPDGAGGAIVAWLDYRSLDPDRYAQRLNAAGVAQWAANGVGVLVSPGRQQQVSAVSDGAGGVFLAWFEKWSGEYYPVIRRYAPNGLPVWPLVLLSGSPAVFLESALVPDGAGGAIFAWTRGATRSDLYAQRVGPTGATMWGGNAATVCTSPSPQQNLVATADGAGGAVFAWVDDHANNESRVYAQRIAANGATAWTVNGIGVCNLQGGQLTPAITAATAQGAVLAWTDYRDGIPHVFGQRLDGTGARAWADEGVRVWSAAAEQGAPVAVTDGAGGVILVERDARTGDPDLYAQRLDATGAPMWTSLGVGVCTTSGDLDFPRCLDDGAGGAFVAWQDLRGPNPDVFAQHLDATGAAQWAADGVSVSDDPGEQTGPLLVRDGQGGIVVGWTGGAYPDFDLFAQRLNAGGVAQWTSAGALVCGHASIQREPASAPDDAGGFYMAWQDRRTPAEDLVYAMHLASTGAQVPGWAPDGTTGTQLALAVLDVTVERVHLMWSGAESNAVATIERWSRDADWRPIASLTADADGRIVYDDLAIAAGERYGYRLIVRESGAADRVVGPVWAQVPAADRLALEGARPNPAVRDLDIAFTLASQEPATLELIDVRGRRVATHEVGSLGPGRHTLRIGDGVSPGVYWLRLRQGDRTERARVDVIR